MATQQEIILKFKADTSEIESSIKTVEQDLRKVEDKKIEPVTEETVNDLKTAATAVKDLGKATENTAQKSKSLKAQLKEMKAELNALELAGKTNSARFRELAAAAGALEDQIGDVNARVKALASDTPRLDALISAATGIAGGFSVAQGAVALFGKENEELNEALLKVQAAMAITNGLQAVAQTLNKDSAFSVLGLGKAQLFLNTTMNAFPLVFIVTALAAVAGGLFLLFTNQQKAASGVVDFADRLGVLGRVSLGIATLGLSELVINVAKLTKMFESNEEAAHEAAVTAAAEFAKSTQKQIDNLIEVREAVTERYDFEIRLAKATGKETEDIERKKLEFIKESLLKELQLRKAASAEISKTIIDNGVGAVDFVKQTLTNQEKETAKAFQKANEDLIIFNAEQEQIKKDNAKKAVDAAKDRKEKELKDALDALEKEKKESEKFILETAATEEQANKMRDEKNIEFLNKRINILQKFGQGVIDEEIAILQGMQKIEKSVEEERKKNQEKAAAAVKASDQAIIDAMEEGFEKQKAVRIVQFEEKIADLEEKGILTADLEKQLQQQLIKDLREIDEAAAKEAQDRLIADINARKKIIDAGIKIFEDGVSIISDLIKLSNLDASQAAEFQKTLAVFQVGLELAKSLATVITSATTAAAATGALAPITLAGYIASGLAAVFGAFAQVKQIFDAPVPTPAAKGDEYVMGGTIGKDSVPYMLMPGERVVTTATNDKYWDELHAMHNGYFDKLMTVKYIQPALEKATGGFSENIMGSIMLNGGKWKGENIVGVLNRSSRQQKKQHKEMIKTLKPSRINKRKF
jgi:hypothetical protein